MANLYKLRNRVKHYEWGSPSLIPRLMGVVGQDPASNGAPSLDGEPWAELWMGNLSTVDAPDSPSGEISLAERYGVLPFLFKLLAAEKPLSVQVHPNLAQAREGFERENKAGLALEDPARNYRDANHKPEILCALTPFIGMCGFRSPDEIRRLFEVFHTAPMLVQKYFARLLRTLEMPHEDSALQKFMYALFTLSPIVRMSLTEFILSDQAQASGGDWELVRQFARDYPLDPAIIAPLYLNVFRLEPTEAIFLQAGLPHAYISGLGVELMTNSDNVLRGGLTAKHMDVPELMKILNYNPLKPQIIKPQDGVSCFTYPAPCDEFSLTVMRCDGSGEQTFTPNTPTICIVTEGEVSISGTILKQGESAFIPPVGTAAENGDPLVLQGSYTLYTASSRDAPSAP